MRTAAPVLVLAFLAACGGKGPRDAADGKGVSLELSASAHSGYAPFDVVLIGRLHGTSPDDSAFADPGEKWREMYLDNESVSERQPGKSKARPEGPPKLFYERVVTMEEPGSHSFKLSITGADGRQVHSNWVRVRVLVPR